jgi:hypothetical protein
MAMNRTLPPLDERVTALRAEIDNFIDKRAAEISKECPGVPQGAIRNSITRGMGCQCSSYLQIKAADDAAAAREAAEDDAA